MSLPPSLVAASALVRGWRAAGVRHVCVSPGSRSAPLALALSAARDLEVTVHLDERTAAFVALGIARGGREPVVLVCTSGSAVANWLPAVTEADASHVPLILASADRPPELRDRGAGQTMPQAGILAPFVRWSFDADTPDASTPGLAAGFEELGWRSAWEARAGIPGPVHLNLPFRDPLYPDTAAALDALAGIAPCADRPHAPALLPRPRTRLSRRLIDRIGSARRPALVVGPADLPRATARAILELSDRWVAPILADGASGLRWASEESPVLDASEAVLRSGLWDTEEPDVVLRVGPEPTSKALRAWMSHPGALHLWLHDGAWTHGPGCPGVPLTGDARSLLRRLRARGDDEATFFGADGERRALLRIERAARFNRMFRQNLVARHAIEQGPVPPEAAAMRAVLAACRDIDQVHVASSMPIRDLDSFATLPVAPRLSTNRGVNGIDGTIATAAGHALRLRPGGRMHCVLGDVAALHDAGSLVTLPRLGLPMTIVVINNDGGRIFGFLPAGRMGDAYEPFFGTPHGRSFAGLAATHGLDYRLVTDAGELAAPCVEARESGRSLLLEYRVDGDANRAAYASFWERVAAALEAAERSPRVAGDAELEFGASGGRRAVADMGVGLAATVGAPSGRSPARVVCLHGFTGTGDDFEPMRAASRGILQSAAWCAWDLPGHGDSSSADPPDASGAWVAEGFGLVPQGPRVLIGYSMGARIALDAVVRGGVACEALVLIGGAPALASGPGVDPRVEAGESREARAAADAALAERALALGAPGFAAWWATQPIIATQQRAPRWVRARLATRGAAGSAPGWARALGWFGTGTMPDVWAALGRITCPVLLVTGSEDRRYGELAEAIVRRVPGATHGVVEGAGHAPHLERPAETAALIDTLLASTLSAESPAPRQKSP